MAGRGLPKFRYGPKHDHHAALGGGCTQVQLRSKALRFTTADRTACQFVTSMSAGEEGEKGMALGDRCATSFRFSPCG